MIIQERVVVGAMRQPRIYQMANGDQMEVVWDGADKELLPPAFLAASNFNAEMATQRRWSRAGR